MKNNRLKRMDKKMIDSYEKWLILLTYKRFDEKTISVTFIFFVLNDTKYFKYGTFFILSFSLYPNFPGLETFYITSEKPREFSNFYNP